ncbi:type I-E CRISPR-associated protein Cse2/CasB [Arhodomonas aquaeolei]|uniref:type I-E CRISPR-associated protein Cse2/CasB n=1 Tax=Arhodomonas aquaeolei TaxID=2369 RepID=UPI00036B50DB|nr:type I-E CRISPR-associated protein Cse2/CasB [Arhodomonas aquaeolei]
MSDFEFRPHVLRDRDGESGVADCVLHWWARLLDEPAWMHSDARKGYSPAVRAVLRRAESPDDALLTEGFRSLWFALPSGRRKSWDMPAWGCVAAVLAEVRRHTPGSSFAAAMGAESERGSGKPRVSELRFQQLLQSSDLHELMRRARRAVHLLGDEVHVVSLADDLLHWYREKGGDFASRPDRRLAVRWANDYFTQLPTGPRAGDTA